MIWCKNKLFEQKRIMPHKKNQNHILYLYHFLQEFPVLILAIFFKGTYKFGRKEPRRNFSFFPTNIPSTGTYIMLYIWTRRRTASAC